MGGTPAVRAAALDPSWMLPVIAPEIARDSSSQVVPEWDREANDWKTAPPAYSQTSLKVGSSVLPPKKGETPEEYVERVFRTPVEDVFPAVVEDLVGRLFRRPPALKADVPLVIRGQEANEKDGLPYLEGWWENINKSGWHGDVWGRQLFADAWTDGIVLGLVDKPPGGPADERLDETKRANRRPYLVEIPACCLLRLEPRMVNGDRRVGLLVYEELTEEAGTVVRRIRRYVDGMAPHENANQDEPSFVPADSPLRFATFEVLREVKGKDGGDPEWKRESAGALAPLTFIPVRVLNLRPYRNDPFEAEVPLGPLAESALELWQATTAYKSILEVVSIAALKLKGARVGIVHWGPFRTIELPADGDASFIEHSGAGIGALVVGIQGIREKIRRQSMEPLEARPGNPATATEVASGTSRANSRLEAAANLYKDFLEGLLDYMMQFEGKPAGSGGSVEMQRDALSILGASDFDQVLAMKLDTETTLEEAIRRGVLSEDRPARVIMDRMENEGLLPGQGAADGDLAAQLEELRAQIDGMRAGGGARVDMPPPSGEQNKPPASLPS